MDLNTSKNKSNQPRPLTPDIKGTAKKLGGIFELDFSNHVFTNSGKISKILAMLAFLSTEIIIHAFISSRLDHCNAFSFYLPQCSRCSSASDCADLCSQAPNKDQMYFSHYPSFSLFAPVTSFFILTSSTLLTRLYMARCQSTSMNF